MANDQFNIPDQFSNEKLLKEEAFLAADSFQNSGEKFPEPYENIKKIEDRIHSYRRTRLEIEAQRKPKMLERRQKVTLNSLIDQESHIGGEPFGPNNRFWMSHKGSSPHAAHNNLGDWYHVRQTFDTFGRKTSETTLHFETHSRHNVKKLYDGSPVELTIAELETFTRAVELYEERVREKLYPLDQEIFDLMSEEEADNVVIPDTVEEMFGKEVVARVVEEYKARNGIKDDPKDDYRLAA